MKTVFSLSSCIPHVPFRPLSAALPRLKARGGFFSGGARGEDVEPVERGGTALGGVKQVWNLG